MYSLEFVMPNLPPPPPPPQSASTITFIIVIQSELPCQIIDQTRMHIRHRIMYEICAFVKSSAEEKKVQKPVDKPIKIYEIY